MNNICIQKVTIFILGSGASTPGSNIDVDVESVIKSEVSKIRKERGINKQISNKSEKSGSRKSSFDVKETIREEHGTPSDDLDIDEEFEVLMILRERRHFLISSNLRKMHSSSSSFSLDKVSDLIEQS